MRRFLLGMCLVALFAGVLSGAGLAAKEKPGVIPAPASVDFGILPSGEYTTPTVEFTNTTSYTLHLRFAETADPFSTFSYIGCDNLAPAEKCHVYYAAAYLTESLPGTYRQTVVQPFYWLDQRGLEHTVTAKLKFVVTLTANSRPTAGFPSVTTSQDTAKTITLTGGDPDGDTLSFIETVPGTYPEHGELGDISDISCSGIPSVCTAQVTYTPDSGYTGSDYFPTTASLIRPWVAGLTSRSPLPSSTRHRPLMTTRSRSTARWRRRSR